MTIRIRYKICEGIHTSEGVRNIPGSVADYVETMRKDHPNANSIYLEYLDEKLEPENVEIEGERWIIIP